MSDYSLLNEYRDPAWFEAADALRKYLGSFHGDCGVDIAVSEDRKATLSVACYGYLPASRPATFSGYPVRYHKFLTVKPDATPAETIAAVNKFLQAYNLHLVDTETDRFGEACYRLDEIKEQA